MTVLVRSLQSLVIRHDQIRLEKWLIRHSRAREKFWHQFLAEDDGKAKHGPVSLPRLVLSSLALSAPFGCYITRPR